MDEQDRKLLELYDSFQQMKNITSVVGPNVVNYFTSTIIHKVTGVQQPILVSIIILTLSAFAINVYMGEDPPMWTILETIIWTFLWYLLMNQVYIYLYRIFSLNDDPRPLYRVLLSGDNTLVPFVCAACSVTGLISLLLGHKLFIWQLIPTLLIIMLLTTLAYSIHFFIEREHNDTAKVRSLFPVTFVLMVVSIMLYFLGHVLKFSRLPVGGDDMQPETIYNLQRETRFSTVFDFDSPQERDFREPETTQQEKENIQRRLAAAKIWRSQWEK